MAGKQAKILTRQQVVAALRRARRGRYPRRDRVIILLSVRAGLRAGEIAKLTWSMVLDADRRIADRIELHDSAAKKGSGRTIPLRRDLRRALQQLRRHTGAEGVVIRSERGGSQGMRPGSVVNWFRRLYHAIGLRGCSSHSGRRTFITNAARLVFNAGGSLRDVQQLAGHRRCREARSRVARGRTGRPRSRRTRQAFTTNPTRAGYHRRARRARRQLAGQN